MSLNSLRLYWTQLSSLQRRAGILLFCILPWLPWYWAPAPAPTVTKMPAEPAVQTLPLFSDNQLQNMLQQHDIQIQQLIFQSHGIQLRFSSHWSNFHAWLKAIAESSHQLYFYQLQTNEGNISGQLTLNRARYQRGPDLAHIESLLPPPPEQHTAAQEETPCLQTPIPAIQIRAIWPQRNYVVLSKSAQPTSLQRVYIQHLLPGERWRLTAINEKSIEISALSSHLSCSQQRQLSMN
ncbi:hypothetical protein CWE09_12005 [Aliidiomarina minuta]|uniref:Uncharacterized protein n=1 Tax=Aliidiomarina minuta TaxID=880057 RepID=A0A432W3D8_9GAMM|nr:hypothetical protein [Aliidiomarina minuta]RUO23870.1 hypothetical protein CWE09_12005 [Aliidiomarina minuta]